MIITSLENEKVKKLVKLQKKKYRDLEGIYVVEGEHLVLEASKAQVVLEYFILEGEDFAYDGQVTFVSYEVMKKITMMESVPKIVALCKKRDNLGIVGKRVLLLDEVQDPGNLGTIIRSAVAFNIDTIILSEKCADVYSSKVVRASQGMLFHINILVKKLYECIPKLQTQDYRVFGTKVTLGNDIKTLEKMKKFAIIMGNEGNGVKKELLDMCDEYIYIKMNESCESLNVAVATSIILYELDK